MSNQNRLLQIERHNIYGQMVSYPANDVARTFAQIAGTKTLKPSTLEAAEKLGFVIQQVQAEGPDAWRNRGSL